MIQKLYSVTTEKAEALRSALASCGVSGARVRKMRNGKARLVLASSTDRDAARDALVLVDARGPTGRLFTDPDSRFAWNGPVEIFLWFGTP